MTKIGKVVTKNIRFNLPTQLLYRVKIIANSMGVSYQSLIKIFLSEKVNEELSAMR